MLMLYKQLPKQTVIDIVKVAINYVRGLPKPCTNIYPIQPPKQLVINKLLYMLLIQMGQYRQGIQDENNDIKQKKMINSLYNRPKENKNASS